MIILANKKCPICKKQYPDLASVSEHIETTHNDKIPNNWSGAKYLFFSNHGRTCGKCRICKKETDFNEITGKPEIMCKNKKCHEVYRQNFVNNMINKHGKTTLLNDPEMQKKMLSNRSISKKYKWSDGSEKLCIGSYEYDFAQFLDVFMNFNSNDVMFPAPMVIEYEYNNDIHFYIPDVYIGSLNLIIEIKDGGNNANTRPSIVAVDKVKEKAKEQAIKKQGKYNYVKIPNKEYGIFLDTLIKLKDQENVGNENEKIVPIMMIKEYAEILTENCLNDELEGPRKRNINLVRFSMDAFNMLEYGLNIENDIYVYRQGIINREDINTVCIHKLYHYNRDMNEYDYNNLTKTIKTIVGRTFNDNDVNSINFPLYALYEYSTPFPLKDENIYQRIISIVDFDDIGEEFHFMFKSYIDNMIHYNYTESVENIDMIDIDKKITRTIEELNLYKPTKYELDISKLIINAYTLELLEIPKTYIITVYDQMKHALLNTLLELQTIKITVKNQ